MENTSPRPDTPLYDILTAPGNHKALTAYFAAAGPTEAVSPQYQLDDPLHIDGQRYPYYSVQVTTAPEEVGSVTNFTPLLTVIAGQQDQHTEALGIDITCEDIRPPSTTLVARYSLPNRPELIRPFGYNVLRMIPGEDASRTQPYYEQVEVLTSGILGDPEDSRVQKLARAVGTALLDIINGGMETQLYRAPRPTPRVRR